MSQATNQPRLIKVSGSTGRQLEVAAAVEGRQMKEIAEEAITEYISARHPDIFETPVEDLRLTATKAPSGTDNPVETAEMEIAA